MINIIILLFGIANICFSLKNPVLKFGGSSLANIDRLKNVGDIVNDISKNDEIPIVVLSAIGTTTNKLLEASYSALYDDDITKSLSIINDIKSNHYLIFNFIKNNSKNNLKNTIKFERDTLVAKRDIDEYFTNLINILKGINLLNELSPTVIDSVSSYGERLSVRLFAYLINNVCIEDSNIEAEFYDSWDIGLKTEGNHNDSKFIEDQFVKDNVKNNLESIIKRKKIPIITGFICKNSNGKITTLGRGGSDLTATFIGECCESKEIQVWKDVNGLMTADPKVVQGAKPLSKLSYEQASELAYFGAKILHPISMLPAKKSEIPVIIKNSYNITNEGTFISKKLNDDIDKEYMVAMTSKKDITLIDIVSTRMLEQTGFLSKVFKIFEEDNISIDVIATSEISISLTLDNKNIISENAIDKLNKISCVRVKKDYSILSFIVNIEKSNDVLSKILYILSKNGIKAEMISQGASKVNISIVIQSIDVNKALNLIHNSFF